MFFPDRAMKNDLFCELTFLIFIDFSNQDFYIESNFITFISNFQFS